MRGHGYRDLWLWLVVRRLWFVAVRARSLRARLRRPPSAKAQGLPQGARVRDDARGHKELEALEQKADAVLGRRVLCKPIVLRPRVIGGLLLYPRGWTRR